MLKVDLFLFCSKLRAPANETEASTTQVSGLSRDVKAAVPQIQEIACIQLSALAPPELTRLYPPPGRDPSASENGLAFSVTAEGI